MKANRNVVYSPVSKALHWIIAIVVITMLSLSFFLGNVPKSYSSLAYMMHKSLGLTVLFLMVFRLVSICKGKPSLPLSVPAWQRYLSRFIHYSLYLLLIMLPLTGWIMTVAANKAPLYWGLIQLSLPGIEPNKHLAQFMNSNHKILAWVTISFLIIHIVAALKHHYINKDNVLKSMLPVKQVKSTSQINPTHVSSGL